MMCLLQLLPKYEPGKDAEFMTYAHNFIFDSIRNYQMGKESWSLPSLTTYKKIRTAAWMQNNLENAVEAFMEKYKCRRKTADRFFREANCLHRRKETILLDDEEEERDKRHDFRLFHTMERTKLCCQSLILLGNCDCNHINPHNCVMNTY